MALSIFIFQNGWLCLPYHENGPLLVSFTSATCCLCEAALISKENGTPVLVFLGECQSNCWVLVCEHRSPWRMLAVHATFMESVSGTLVRNMSMSRMLKVILLSSGSAPQGPPFTNEQIQVLQLGWNPFAAMSSSCCVMSHLLVLPWDCPGDTPNLLVTAHIDILSWRSHVCNSNRLELLPAVTKILAKSKAEKNQPGESTGLWPSAWHLPLQSQFHLHQNRSNGFTMVCFLTGQTDISEV